jgi:hypothetical protein
MNEPKTVHEKGDYLAQALEALKRDHARLLQAIKADKTVGKRQRERLVNKLR